MEERDVEDLWHNNVLDCRVFFRILEHLIKSPLKYHSDSPQRKSNQLVKSY